MMRSVALLCVVVAFASAVAQSPSVGPSIAEAEKLVHELAQILADVKNAVQPRHCGDLLRSGQSTSGVYTIFHKAAGPSGQRVYCDMETDGGGWTVIQRRGQFGNRVFHFYRNWTEYANGFGNPSDEYWIGNHALHTLTSGDEEMALRVVLSNNTEDSVSVDYESVRIASEADLFKIQVGKHLGPAGWDAFNVNGRNFSTFDRDNDVWPQNCAVTFRGAWWYSSCHASNLNGLNLNGHHDSHADGIEWSARGVGAPGVQYYSYPSAFMMIRPAGFLLDRRISVTVAAPSS
ncbi:techylectin-5A-like [Dermacentor andersoni]|uniref:techylectin-5A-like n=1 Tax=Dermacentor andersoni TaxID=34620 RepID=UPI003B3B92F2